MVWNLFADYIADAKKYEPLLCFARCVFDPSRLLPGIPEIVLDSIMVFSISFSHYLYKFFSRADNNPDISGVDYSI
jgi:hypothetical protein